MRSCGTMRRSCMVFVTVLLFSIFGGSGISRAANLQDGTPTATAGEIRFGRLGGRYKDFESIYGKADKNKNGIFTFELLDEFGAQVDVGVFKTKIVSITLTWEADFTVLGEEVDSVVVALIPLDRVCEEKTVNNGWGKGVTLCHSAALEKAFTKETLNSLGFKGERGDFSYRTDIGEDDISTVELRLGHDKYVAPTPTPIPPTPTPTFDEKLAAYTPLADVRELAIRPGGFIGKKIMFYGSILSIQVASPGKGFYLGDNESIWATVAMQVKVAAPDGSTEVIFVAYDGDTTGMFEDSYVAVYGEVVDTQSFTNALGGPVTQPLVEAFYVTL